MNHFERVIKMFVCIKMMPHDKLSGRSIFCRTRLAIVVLAKKDGV
jgi:hypothetical protein